MKRETRRRIIRSTVGIALAIWLLFSSGLKVPGLDATADTYFQDAITKAGLAYATIRTINASVSIIKESTVQLEPAGVGLSLAVGQVLDPIDDMTERLSHVLVTAIVSLGVQKLSYEIAISLVPPLFAAALIILSVLIWVGDHRLGAIQHLVFQVLLFSAIFRFFLPVSSIANAFVHDHFFAGRIETAKAELSLGSTELDRLKELSLPEIEGVWTTIEKGKLFLKKKSAEFKEAVVYTVDNMGRIIENLMELTFLYVGLFVIQVLFLPLISFWILLKIVNALFVRNAFIPPTGSSYGAGSDTAMGTK